MRRLLGCAAIVLAAGCSTARDVAAPPPPPPRAVVLVPGITGTRLCDAKSGAVLWGDPARMMVPWDGGYTIALPLTGRSDDVVPCGVIREMRIAQWRKDIYGGMIGFMERNGYAEDFKVFDYDWRRDNVTSARLLTLFLDRMADKHRAVTLICQSNGAHICRYAVKYGDVSLADAEKGSRRLSRLRVEQVILLGTANGGAIRILRELNRGRRYIGLIGRRFRPETFFTYPALFQDLPVHRNDLFVNERGEAMNIDLFDPKNWQTYNWSVFAPEVESRVQRSEKFGTAAERLVYLDRTLAEARRFHELLRRDTGIALPRYYSIQSRDLPTPSRAMLLKQSDRWRTLLNLDVPREDLTSPGDRHATIESQQWLSSEEINAFVEPTIYVHGRHFEMITTDRTRGELLRILRKE